MGAGRISSRNTVHQYPVALIPPSMKKKIEPISFVAGLWRLANRFADRETELDRADQRHAQRPGRGRLRPRRCGKSSLVLARRSGVGRGAVLVAQVDLMTDSDQGEPGRGAWPSRSAELIAIAVWSGRWRRSWLPFAGLQLQPEVQVDPRDGSLSFSFAVGSGSGAEIDATLERLLRATRRAGRRARAACGPGHGRVPGDRRDRREPAEASARGLPATA